MFSLNAWIHLLLLFETFLQPTEEIKCGKILELDQQGKPNACSGIVQYNVYLYHNKSIGKKK